MLCATLRHIDLCRHISFSSRETPIHDRELPYEMNQSTSE